VVGHKVVHSGTKKEKLTAMQRLSVGVFYSERFEYQNKDAADNISKSFLQGKTNYCNGKSCSGK
jgi:hypothetical protein